jgi:hypothetical protein
MVLVQMGFRLHQVISIHNVNLLTHFLAMYQMTCYCNNIYQTKVHFLLKHMIYFQKKKK